MTFFTLLTFCVLAVSNCGKSSSVIIDPPVAATCDNPVLIDADLYENAPSDEFLFQSATIDGNCLKMIVRYGGGCEAVTFQLIDAAAIMESLPVQRNIRLSLKDEDDCEALVTRELYYDLTPLQVEGNSKIILNLQGFPESLTYQY